MADSRSTPASCHCSFFMVEKEARRTYGSGVAQKQCLWGAFVIDQYVKHNLVALFCDIYYPFQPHSCQIQLCDLYPAINAPTTSLPFCTTTSTVQIPTMPIIVSVCVDLSDKGGFRQISRM